MSKSKTIPHFWSLRILPLLVGIFVSTAASAAAASQYAAFPLHDATKRGDLEGVTECLLQGADVNGRAGRHETALHIAAEKGFLAIAQLLVDRGADVDARMMTALTPMSLAVHAGSLPIVRFLADHGANLYDRTMYIPLLHIAARAGSLPIVRFLVDEHGADVNGADVNGHNQCIKATPLGEAIQAIHANSLPIVQFLVERGANINARASFLGTPLHAAIWIGKIPALRYLLAAGADIRITDRSGRTPLEEAAGACKTYLKACDGGWTLANQLVFAPRCNEKMRAVLLCMRRKQREGALPRFPPYVKIIALRQFSIAGCIAETPEQ